MKFTRFRNRQYDFWRSRTPNRPVSHRHKRIRYLCKVGNGRVSQILGNNLTMYAGFFQCLAFAGICLAIPATTRYDSSQSLDPNGPLQGFPAEYSPLELSLSEYETYIHLESDRGESISSLAMNCLGALAKPLNPDPRWHLEQEIFYGDQNAPSGAELIASMTATI